MYNSKYIFKAFEDESEGKAVKSELEFASGIIKRLEKNGFEAFLVGGFVRDFFSGKSGDDVDITTNASAQTVLELFSDYKTIPTGLKHGTVTVVSKGIGAEITTYRTEKGYSDNRHPDGVEFCADIYGDLSRRDFTINALAFNEKDGIIDLFGGLSDLKNGIIRAIGDPQKRFCEDALRILRAVRFCAKTGFSIEPKTKEAMLRCKDLLFKISNERIASELSKTLCAPYAAKSIEENYEIICTVIPELCAMRDFDQHNFHHKYDLLRHTTTVLKSVEPVLHLRLAALFHDCAKVDCFSLDENGVGHFYSHASLGAKKTEQALKRLKFDNETITKTVKLVKIHDSPVDEDERVIKRKLQKYSKETFFDLIALQRADTMGLADEFRSRLSHFDRLEKMTNEVIKSQECFSVKGLAIDGNDVKSLGLFGKQIGDALNLCVEAVIDKKTENEKNQLLDLIKKAFAVQ